MKLQKLSLANFRGFQQIGIEFDPTLTVIAGINGIGKSGILHALTILLSQVLPAITPSKAKSRLFSNEDIREGETSLTATSRFSLYNHDIDMTIHQSVLDMETADNAREKLKKVRIQISESAGDKESLRELKEEERYLLELLKKSEPVAELLIHGLVFDEVRTGDLGAAERIQQMFKKKLRNQKNQPVAIFFSPERQIIKEVRKLPKPTPLQITAAYQNALESRPLDMGHFVHWYRVQQKLGTSQSEKRKKILDNLKKVISSFIPEITDLRVQEKPTPRFQVLKNDIPFSLHQLSDGERGLITMIFDITRRLTLANPEMDDPISEGAGIVLIDEIELHLHPLWQRLVLKRLKEIFTNCQFIVTTHSPLVLGEVEARCIRFLERDGTGKITCTVPDKAYGLDANRVLEELMGARVRNREIDDQLARLFEKIDDEDFDAARLDMNALRQKLGQNDPELTRASSLIKFLEGEA